MIFKKIPNPKKSARKVERIRRLADYIVAPERKNGVEKCIHAGAIGFVCNDFESQKAEMIALAASAVRSLDPVNHYMISWGEDENPTPMQVDEAADMFVRHMGLDGHQVFYALHDDTANRHIHIAINRVHPVTGKVVEINGGFDKEAGHQAIALIEAKQGWRTLTNSVYLVTEQGTLERRSAAKEKKLRQPTTEKRDRELQHGEKSAERIAQEIASPIIRQAISWQELHALLAKQGMRFERKGSGALIYVGDVALKASNVDRQGSFSAMQKRLGPYEERRHSVILPNTSHLTQRQLAQGAKRALDRNLDFKTPYDNILHLDEHRRRLAAERRGSLHELSNGVVATQRQNGEVLLPGTVHVRVGEPRAGQDHNLRRPRARPSGSSRISGRGTGRTPEPLVPSQPAWPEYLEARDARKAEKVASPLDLKTRHEVERKALAARLKAERAAALVGDWRGKGMARNALASVIATQQAAEKLALRERHATERKTLRDRCAPMPAYREWKLTPAIVGKIAIEDEAVIRARIAADQADRLSTVLRQLEYAQDWCGRMVYRSRGIEIFRDEGHRLAILDPHSNEAIAAALVVAQERFGRTLTLTGDPSFQRRVLAVAVANKLPVRFADPELEKLRLELAAQQRPKRTERLDSDYDRIKAWRKEKRAAEHAAAAKATSEPAQAPEKALEEKPKDRIAIWLEAHRVRQVRAPAPLPASGRVLAVAEDGRILLNLNRAGDVAVYPALAGFTPQVDDLLNIDKYNHAIYRGQVLGKGKDE